MKSQDIFILLKLASLQRQEKSIIEKQSPSKMYIHGWEGWEIAPEEVDERQLARHLLPLEQASRYTARGLAEELGVGKTEVNNAIKRCIAVGMATLDRHTGRPKANFKVLREFIVYGLKYVFPAAPAKIARGIPTSFAAPVLEGQLMTAGELINVWPDARGKSKGQSVTPLFKSVTYAVKKDPLLYEYLALVDAIRLGSPREAVRYTDDVDLIINVVGYARWAAFQERLRTRGFCEAMDEDVNCRMRLGELQVDFMPDDENILGFSNRWYAAGLGGNNLRIMAMVLFTNQKFYVKYIVTHTEYDKLCRKYRKEK